MRKEPSLGNLYLQQGHGLTILLDLLKEHIGDGIILSPSNIAREKFKSTLGRIRRINNNIIFDPQFFIARFQQTDSFKYLPDYNFFTKQIAWKDLGSRSSRQNYIRKVIDFQIDNGFNKIVTPSLYCEDLKDSLFQININLAEESVDYIKNKSKNLEIIASFPINGSEFNIQENRDDFLSVVTSLQGVSTFYLLFSSNAPDLGPLRDSLLLAGWLEVTYYLIQNRFNVLMGYCDQSGLLFSALGADIATGTYGNLRKFNVGKWTEERTGGRKKIRYYVPNLMTCILVPDDLVYLQQKKLLSEISCADPYCRGIFEARDLSAFKWQEADSYKHYIANIYKEIKAMNRLQFVKRIGYIREKIKTAKDFVKQLKSEKITGFVGAIGGMDHLDAWEKALNEFQERNLR